MLWFGYGLSAFPKGSCVGTLVPSVAILRGSGTLTGGGQWEVIRQLEVCLQKGLR